jgi:hypothetical protein
MKANLKNYLLIGRFFLMGVIGASLLTACSDDDDPEPDPVALSTPVKSGDVVATPTSLTFSWQSVANAGSYSYELKNASGTTLESGTTANTSICFYSLTVKTSYSLEVVAVPTDTQSYLNSAKLTLAGTTTDYNQLATPTQAADPEATVNSLTFAWNAVSGAAEYAYTLKDAAGTEVATGTTDKTSLYFSPLAEGTTYTLEIIAKPAASDAESKESAVLTLTGTTIGYTALATPQVSVEVAARTVVTWNVVENAEYYTYSYELNGVQIEQTTTDTSLTLDFLPLNTAVTISVVASNTTDELLIDSEAGTVTATRTRTETGRTVGIWDGTDTKVNVVSYSDGSYTLEGWYGVEGYDLTYLYDTTNQWVVTDTYYQDGWNWADTGVDANGMWFVSTYTGWSSAYGDMNEGGVWFYVWVDNNYKAYWVYWPVPASGEEETPGTGDEQGDDLGELVKENVKFYYSSKLSDFYADLYKKTLDDGTVLYTFKNFMKGENLQFTLDASDNMTFTNLNVIEYGGVPYYLWGTDWSDSYKLYLTAEEGYYLDYCYFYGDKGFNFLHPEGDPNYSNLKWGMITFNYYKYAEGSDSYENGYEYIYITMD